MATEKAPSSREVIDAFTDTKHVADEFGINEKALVRRLDYKLLPALCLLYLLSFLDRSNVGNARIEGLTENLNITGDEYLTGLTMFFIGYVIFEVPCNIVLKVWTPRMWLPTLTVIWGVVATLMGLSRNKEGFFAVRFFLGVAEAGLFPGIVYYLSMWYKRNERQYRVALFFSAASLAGAFGGILAYGIGFMSGVGGYLGWRWIFILEGLATFLIGLGSYFFVYNYPATATFLSDKERGLIEARLQADSDAISIEAFDWQNVKKAFTDIKVYLYCLGFHTMSLPLYILSLFLPSIIKNLGYTAARAQLLTIPPYAVAFITTVAFAMLSERYRQRAPFIILGSCIAIIGYILLISEGASAHPRPGVSYTGTIFAAAGIYPSVALVLAWPANNVSGQTKRAVANAMQIMIGNLGAVLGTQLYRTETAPAYILGHSFALGYLVANVIVVPILRVVLSRANKSRDQQLKTLAEKYSSGVEDDSDRLKYEVSGDDNVRWRFHC